MHSASSHLLEIDKDKDDILTHKTKTNSFSEKNLKSENSV
jgi:hypothetical protein